MADSAGQIQTNSVDQTLALAARIGSALVGGEVIALIGGLGSGKTHFVKGLADGAGVSDPRNVSSPTFVLVHEYAGRVYLYHVDAYRLRGPAEFSALGAEEMFRPGATVVVEWADRVLDALPHDRLTVRLEVAGATQRCLTLEAAGPRSEHLRQAALGFAG